MLKAHKKKLIALD